MLRVLILDIPEFLELGFGFQSGHCSRKAFFFTPQGQIFASFEAQKFPAEFLVINIDSSSLCPLEQPLS